MSNFQVWFDLDGVLADFDGAIMRNKSAKVAKERLLNLISSEYTEYEGLKMDILKSRIKEDSSKGKNLRELKKAYYSWDSLVYKEAGKEGFFISLDLLPGAYEMIEYATKLTGKKPNVCTAPMGDENDPMNHSVIEKKKWVREHFGDMINHIEVTLDKGRVVKDKFDILIDDRQKYCNKFLVAGGTAILHETPTTQNKSSWKDSMIKLREICELHESVIINFEQFKERTS